MKQNDSETESDWRFWKNVKTCLENKNFYLMPPSIHGHFHLILILPVKVVFLLQKHANTKVVNPTITNCCKELHVNVAEFIDLLLKMLPCMKTSLGFLWKPVSFRISKCCHLYQMSLCFSLLLFTVWWSIFDQLFRWV